MRWMISAAVLFGATIAMPAVAQDANAYRALSTGDLALAEQELTAQRRDYPARPELMLNLAHVYTKTARPEQARALYREVLSRRDIAMDMPNGSIVTSHALAEMGLTRLGRTTLATR